MLYKSQVAHTLIQVRLVRLTSPFVFFLWLVCYFDTPPLEVRVICHPSFGGLSGIPLFCLMVLFAVTFFGHPSFGGVTYHPSFGGLSGIAPFCLMVLVVSLAVTPLEVVSLASLVHLSLFTA